MAAADDPVRLWVTSPGRAASLSKRLNRDTPLWCYLGTDVHRRDASTRGLPDSDRVDLAVELDRAAGTLRRPFLDWIAGIGARQRDPVRWWCSEMASKSPVDCDLFLLLCYAAVVRGWVDDAGVRTRLVIVEDPWLRRHFFRAHGMKPGFASDDAPMNSCARELLLHVLRLPLSLAYAAGWALGMMLLGRLLFRRPAAAEPADRSVLLFTWLETRCFPGPGRFADIHFGRLAHILTQAGEKVRRLTFLRASPRLLSQLSRLETEVVASQLYLSLWDLLSMTTRIFWIDRLVDFRVFRDMDVRELLYREILIEWGRPAFQRNDLWFRSVFNTAGALRGRVKAVIFPFENQPWEKLLCLAWRRAAPETSLLGYQHSGVPDMLLNYALGAREAAISPLPDRIVTSGSWTRDLLITNGFPRAMLVDGGALRYEELHTDPHERRPGATAPRVLVTLPLAAPYARSLLIDLVEELREPLRLGGRDEPPVQFLLKPHPGLPIEALASGVAELRLPSWIRVSDRPVEESLQQTSLVLYVPPTASWFGALASGVPILKYRPELLDIDHRIDREIPTCSRRTLRETVSRLLQSPAGPAPADPQLFRRLFGPVDEAAWKALVSEAVR